MSISSKMLGPVILLVIMDRLLLEIIWVQSPLGVSLFSALQAVHEKESESEISHNKNYVQLQ